MVLPGVGAFDYVMKSFNKSGLRDAVEKKVFSDKTPVLGICAGMQIMADTSEEGCEKGLSWIPGRIRYFDISKIFHRTKVPHMGWNEIAPNGSSLFEGVKDKSRFYFVHSYYFDAGNNSDIIATTNYGDKFASSVSRKNVYGVQFHPEKSHSNGMQLLKNFAEFI